MTKAFDEGKSRTSKARIAEPVVVTPPEPDPVPQPKASSNVAEHAQKRHDTHAKIPDEPVPVPEPKGPEQVPHVASRAYAQGLSNESTAGHATPPDPAIVLLRQQAHEALKLGAPYNEVSDMFLDMAGEPFDAG